MRRVFCAFALCLAAAGSMVTGMSWDHFDGTAQVTMPDGSTLFRESYGFFNMPHNVPMYHDAQFPIASNTKLFTSVAMYQLQERGLLNVTDDIADYLNATDFAKFGHKDVTTFCPTLFNTSSGDTGCQRITFRDLMSMSSGIYGEMRCDSMEGSAIQAAYCRPDSFIAYPGSIALMVGTFITNKLGFVPGTNYEYANPNFILCAYFIEKLSGMSFGSFLKANIFDVVGLPNTYFDPYTNQFAINTNRVGEYHRFIDSETNEHIAFGQNTVDFDSGSLSGTGGLVSSIADMEKWYRTLFNFTAQGAPLLSDPASFKAILSPWTKIKPPALVPTFYTQGVIIVCNKGDDECTGGPAFIIYEGGTLCVHTANILDVRHDATTNQRRYQLVQVFANSVRYNTTRTLYAEATSGVGRGVNFFELAAMISVVPSPGAMGMAWQLQAEYGPSPYA